MFAVKRGRLIGHADMMLPPAPDDPDPKTANVRLNITKLYIAMV